MIPPDSSLVVLSWQPTEDDTIEALRARGRSRRTTVRIAASIALMLGVAVIGLWAREPFQACVGIVAASAVFYVFGPGRRRGIRSGWRQSPALHSRVEARVVPGEGLTVVRPGFTGRYSWAMFDAVVETDRLFLLRLAGRRGDALQVLAKRGLASEADVARLRELLSREITPGSAGAAARRWPNP